MRPTSATAATPSQRPVGATWPIRPSTATRLTSPAALFLAWAARNAAEPAYAGEAAQDVPGPAASRLPKRVATTIRADDGDEMSVPTPEGGLFGLPMTPRRLGRCRGA